MEVKHHYNYYASCLSSASQDAVHPDSLLFEELDVSLLCLVLVMFFAHVRRILYAIAAGLIDMIVLYSS